MEHQNNRRRQLIVNREFQNRYILGSVLSAIVIINLTLSAAFLLADSWQDVLPQNLGFAITVALAELVAVLIVVWLALKASHRISGPAYRLAQLMDALGRGDLTPRAKLRDGDCLREVADAFNTALPGLREKVIDVKTAAAAVRNALQGRDEASEPLQRLDAALAALHTDSTTSP